MYLPTRSSRICPYSKQKEYCLAPELRIGSVSASTSNLLYNCGENHVTSALTTFSGWKMGWSLTYPARAMRMFSNQDLESSWRSDAVKEAMGLQPSGQPRGAHFPCLTVSPAWSTQETCWFRREEASPHGHILYSCKGRWKLQTSRGSCPVAIWRWLVCFFFPEPWEEAPALFCFQGSRVWMMWLMLGTIKKAITERMMFLQIEKIVSVGELCFGCS